MPVKPEDDIVTRQEKEAFETMPEGKYTFQVVDVYKIKNVIGYKGKVQDKLFFYCAVLNPEYRKQVVVHETTTAYNAGFDGGSASRFYNLACAISGDILDDSEPIRISSLINGCFSGKTQNKTVNDRVYTNIIATIAINGKVDKLNEQETADVLDVVSKIHGKISARLEQSGNIEAAETSEDEKAFDEMPF